MYNVTLQNLSIGYQGKHLSVIADNINETAEEGSLVCIVGPNGGGKSTLLKTLCRFLPPLGGDIIIGDKNINHLSTADVSRLIGVVLTQRGNYNALTGEELVGIGRAPYTGFFGKLGAEDKRMVSEAMRSVGVENLAHRRVESLSDGERQKLMIAKTLAQDTPIIILDEPTAFLDYPSKVEIMVLLKNLCRENRKTVFISTHDLDIAFSMTDFLWMISKDLGFVTGSITQLGNDGEIERFFQSKLIKFNVNSRHFIIDSIYNN